MDPILELRKEHLQIEDLLIFLEEMIDEGKFDVNQIKGTFGKLFLILKNHEAKEEVLFPNICKFSKEMRDSLEDIEAVHKVIKGHIKVIQKALSSNDLNYIKVSMKNDGIMLFSKLREHMRSEEGIFDSIIFLKPLNS